MLAFVTSLRAGHIRCFARALALQAVTHLAATENLNIGTRLFARSCSVSLFTLKLAQLEAVRDSWGGVAKQSRPMTMSNMQPKHRVVVHPSLSLGRTLFAKLLDLCFD